MIIFCHLLNDNSGSPVVLKSTIEALTHKNSDNLLFIGSHGSGLLDQAVIKTNKYWYRKSSNRVATLFTYLASQFALFYALLMSNSIPKDALIFVNTLLPFGAIVWGKWTNRRVIIHIHEGSITPAPFRWLLIHIASKCASQLIYVSNDQLKRFPIEGPPAIVIANPVSTNLVMKAGPYSPRRSGKFNVLMLTSLKAYKGVQEFMSLAHGLVDREDISFTLVLNADLRDVEVFIKRHSDAINVDVHPKTNDPSIFYRYADIVLNLSRVDQIVETFGLTIVEAMTFGIPVIVPPVGGPAEIISNGFEGFCIDSRDSKYLHNAVLLLANDPRITVEMSKAANISSKIFTFENYSKNLRGIIEMTNQYLYRR
jgi:glycosyltransferase involved in cell wall biosynthesis